LTFRPPVCSPVTLSSALSINVNRSVSNQDQMILGPIDTYRQIHFRQRKCGIFCPICLSHTFLSTKLEVSMTFLLRVNQNHGRTDGRTDGRTGYNI